MFMETKRNVVLAPLGAIQQNPQGAFVYVIQPDQSVRTRMVKIGWEDGMTTVILDGLSPGEIVVVDGMDGLHDGAKVRWSLAPIKK
jgi:multidrug efflux system membrane fusion protein